MIDIALHYAKNGWRIFPLAAGAKIPVIPKEHGGRGCRDAITDASQVERWWSEHPRANVGLATGRGTLVLDIDPRKADKWLESVQTLALPQTFTVRTPNGFHLYFSMPLNTGITVGVDLLPGIDWRGDGGYVVAAGSSVGGKLYEIARNLPIAKAPQALIERLQAAKGKRKTIEPDATGHGVIPTTRRNDTLMRIGCAIRRWGVEYNAVLESLKAINADHCGPPLADDEIRQIAASCVRYEAAGGPKGAA